MFAAASGARLAHRHNKAVKKQISASQIEGYKVQYKSCQKQQQLKYSDIHGNRYPGIPHKRPNYSSKLYTSNCDSGLKLSSSYIEINGRISKLGHVDFEGKAAWQDRELLQLEVRRESVCIPNEAVLTHRTKQKEAHRRWVKRNRIHDLSFGDLSSDEEEFLYGVQNDAANLLLYIGLGTMCVGMIIAFVGTGEKGFKTMELRLIGPSLIGAGVLIIILRIMLCVCPSKCLKLKRHKQKLKNSTNKLNSEGLQACSSSKEPLSEESSREKTEKTTEGKKRVSISMLPIASGLSTNSSDNHKASVTPTYPDMQSFPTSTVSFVEYEKPKTSKASTTQIPNLISTEESTNANFEIKKLDGSDLDVTSFGSQSSCTRKFFNLPETVASPDNSDISITSLASGSEDLDPKETKKTNASKFEITRNPKNLTLKELVLSPSNLNESTEAG